MENRDLSPAEWLDKAEAYCARAEHCAAEVQRKLLQWGAPADLFDEIEEKLYERDFLNDRRFCRAYVHDKVEFQQWGRLKIRAGLQALHLPSTAIDEALAGIDEARYADVLRRVAALRRGATDEQKLRFLLQRGFTFDEIRNILK